MLFKDEDDIPLLQLDLEELVLTFAAFAPPSAILSTTKNGKNFKPPVMILTTVFRHFFGVRKLFRTINKNSLLHYSIGGQAGAAT